MKKKVREEFGRELNISYDQNFVEDSDEELLALEADQVNDAKDLPGSDLKVFIKYILYKILRIY